jgi:RNA polymerase sigma factor (sigma-70 family)
MHETPATTASDVPRLVDHLFRHQAGQVVATLTRIFGPQHLDLAEDVVQETLIKALRHWSYQGVPENPAGWIMRVAKNHALDALRRDARLAARQMELARALGQMTEGPDDAAEDELRDDQLRMMFACCHPAISHEARVALTLKTLCGFGVAEIARAFLTLEPTIAQRLVRAKRALRETSEPLSVPDTRELPNRIDAVLEALYLLFNEGYSAHQGEDLIRHDLCAEAIRLAGILSQHPVGDTPKVHALLALMLLQAARLPGRTDAAGDILLLEAQDRSRWDQRLIERGMTELARSATGDELSQYHLQAGIAACHATAPSYAHTDWQRILSQYDALVERYPSPVAELNRAVAVLVVHGPEIGWFEIERIGSRPGMDRYYLYHAVRAEFARLMGDLAAAAAGYGRALGLATNGAEQRLLRRKLADVMGESLRN